MSHLEVVKRSGTRQSEQFDADKLYTSVLAACLSVRSPEGEAEMIARHVSTFVQKWCESRSAVTAHDIRRVAAQFLDQLHADAAYLYQNHQQVI